MKILKVLLSIFLFSIVFCFNSVDAKTDVRILKPYYFSNFYDSRNLIGSAHNIVIAKVIKQVGSTNISKIPYSQFEVEIIRNIKGNLTGKIMIYQLGGVTNGVFYVVEPYNDKNYKNYLLQLGETYLLALRYNSKNDSYTLNSHPNARKLISSNRNLTNNQLRELTKNDKKVNALESAYPNEVLLKADVMTNNTLNSYKSLKK
jgi:hypothetical protein